MAPSNNRNPNTNQPPVNDQPPPNVIDINSPNHPLYLHPNDHPGLILISKKLIGFENYSSRKRSMMIALNAKNKLKIVTSEMIKPTVESEERALWERTNDMIISWILNTISDHISNKLNFVNSASALWNELFEHYAQLDGHRIYQLVNDIVNLKQQNCSIDVYYHKLKGLWDEHDALEAPYLCNCACSYENKENNGDKEQRKSLIKFLMGLNECYSNLRGHSNDECYKLKGYPIGHPLHGKYKPPVTSSVNVNDNRNPKVNFVHGNDTASTSTQAEASTSGNDAQCQKDPPTGKVNSYTIRIYKFTASVMSRFKTAWGLNKRITHGNLCEGLYIIYPDQVTPTSPTVLSTNSKDNTMLWHSRLGHPSISTLQQIKSISVSCNEILEYNPTLFLVVMAAEMMGRGGGCAIDGDDGGGDMVMKEEMVEWWVSADVAVVVTNSSRDDVDGGVGWCAKMARWCGCKCVATMGWLQWCGDDDVEVMVGQWLMEMMVWGWLRRCGVRRGGGRRVARIWPKRRRRPEKERERGKREARVC
ncbi:cysteine-rich receptor-like protein kinase 8 [Tanacetum coccineum]